MDTKVQKDEAINKKTKEIQTQQEKVVELQKKQIEELERISGLSVDDAKEYLLRNIENEVKHEAAVLIKEVEARAKEECDRKAREIIACAIQKSNRNKEAR